MHLRRIVVAFCLVVSALSGVTSAAAQTKETAATPARASVKFVPPLGRTLRFQVSVQKYKDGKPTSPRPIAWVEEVRYEKADQGFTLYWRMDPASLPPELKIPALAPMIKPYTGAPLAFEVDSSGEVVRAKDWPAMLAGVKTSLNGARPMLLAQPGANAEIVDKVIGLVLGRFANLTPEQAPDVILQNITPIFSWSEFSMAVGETREASIQLPSPLLKATVAGHARVSLVALDAQSATLSDHETIDSAEIDRLLKVLMTQMGEAKVAPAITRADLDIVTDVKIVVDVATGLVSRFELESHAGDGGQVAQRKSITLIR